MRQLPTRHRFSQWDGSQQSPLDADRVLEALANDIMEYGDLHFAMRNMLADGMQMPEGGAMRGLRDLLKQLRERRKEQLERFDLSGILDDFRERLDEILGMERERIGEWLDQRPDTDFSNELLKGIAQRNAEQLDGLPDDLAGRVRELEQYEFLNPDAQRRFLDLLNDLRRNMANSYFRQVENMVQNLSDGDIERMKEMLAALNEMLIRRIAGEDPGFDDFMAKFGDMFGDDPPQSLDELLEQMQRQMAAAQALMNSLSPEQRAELQQLMAGRLGDPELERQLRRLGQELDFLQGDGARYPFRGDERIGLEAAMQLMDEMQNLDSLIAQVQDAERSGSPDRIDRDLLENLLGEDAAEDLDQLNALLKALEDAGYIRPTDGERWELTARGSRMIGQKALGEIYERLKRQGLGNHAVPEEGRFGERLETTRPHEFGDPFHLHLPRTVRNALLRDGPKLPVRLQPDDFEIYRSEMVTSTATAMLVDLSWSMALRGSFQAAKKVAMALHQLISSQYPRDSFYIIGFAAYARELKPQELPYLQWDEYTLGTNMQHALLLAEKLLARHPGGTRQIIMISDGEPTAHIEHGQAQFSYPPTPETIRATFRAVKRCTTRGIAINTFMLESSPYLKAFMDEIARINGGRVFYTSPEQLGEYILVDYVQNRRTRLARRA